MGGEGWDVLVMHRSLGVLCLRLMLQLPQELRLLLCQRMPWLRCRSLLGVVLPQGLHTRHVWVPCSMLLGVHGGRGAEASQLRAVQLRQAQRCLQPAVTASLGIAAAGQAAC